MEVAGAVAGAVEVEVVAVAAHHLERGGAALLLGLFLAERHLLAVEARHALDEASARALLRLRRPRRLERAHALGEVGQQLALVVGRAREPVQERAVGGGGEEVRRRPLAGEHGLVGRLGEA